MKITCISLIAAAGFALALASPCIADQTVVTPTPQHGSQSAPPMGSAPPSYVWDGHEYVGQSGSKYYYLGPHNTWTGLDAARQQRFNQWRQSNPDWQKKEIRNTRYLGHDEGQSQIQPVPNSTAPNGQYPNPPR